MADDPKQGGLKRRLERSRSQVEHWLQLALWRPRHDVFLRRRVPERLFLASYGLAFILTATLLLVDGWGGGVPQVERILFTRFWLASCFLGVVSLCLLLILLEMITYEPELFSWFGPGVGPDVGLSALRGRVDMTTLDHVMADVEGAPPESFSEVKKAVAAIFATANRSCQLDRARFCGALAVMFRLVLLTTTLALFGYGLCGIRGSEILSHMPAGGGFGEHLYFTVVTFFTIGFGDLSPGMGAPGSSLGYLYVATSAVLLVYALYFSVGHVIASHSAFEINFRSAIETFVGSRAKL